MSLRFGAGKPARMPPVAAGRCSSFSVLGACCTLGPSLGQVEALFPQRSVVCGPPSRLWADPRAACVVGCLPVVLFFRIDWLFLLCFILENTFWSHL